MFKKNASLILVAALVCTLGGTPAFAQTAHKPETKSDRIDDPSSFGSVGTKEAQAGKSLRADISKLVADAKANKRVSVTDPQNQPAQSNSLSKGAKIAIGVGIAAAVILVIVLVAGNNTPGRVF